MSGCERDQGRGVQTPGRLQIRYRKRHALSLPGLIQANPLRADVKQKTRFHLPGMISRLVEDFVQQFRAHLKKIDDDDEHATGGLNIAHDRLELVAAVRVEDDEPVDLLALSDRATSPRIAVAVAVEMLIVAT